MNRLTLMLFLATLVFGCGKNNEKSVYTGVVEGTNVEVPALVGGKVEQLLVDTGDRVETGDTLAVLDSTDLHLQMQEVRAGFRELAVQRQLAQTRLRSTEADLDYMTRKLERVKNLVSAQTAPEQQLDDLQSQLTRLQYARQQAQQTLQQLSAKEEQLRAREQQLKKRIRDCVLTAPISGTVTNRYFEAGEAVAPFAPIVELLDFRKMEVKIYVAEQRLPHIRTGQTVTIRTDGLDKELSGAIAWISPKAEFTPKTILTPETRSSLVYAVKITIDNREGYLKHGMPVEVILE